MGGFLLFRYVKEHHKDMNFELINQIKLNFFLVFLKLILYPFRDCVPLYDNLNKEVHILKILDLCNQCYD